MEELLERSARYKRELQRIGRELEALRELIFESQSRRETAGDANGSAEG